VSLYSELFAQLVDAEVRFVVVGGVAVVLHGYARLTADVDLVIDLEPLNVRRCIETLQARGLRPLAPVSALDFADPIKRADWIENKNLAVFTMRDERNPLITVDLFAREPIPFDDLWSRATVFQLAGRAIRVASIPDLIAMKRAVGRAEDLNDIDKLLKLSGDGLDQH
jgi:predicted nucleotidyltransferase